MLWAHTKYKHLLIYNSLFNVLAAMYHKHWTNENFCFYFIVLHLQNHHFVLFRFIFFLEFVWLSWTTWNDQMKIAFLLFIRSIFQLRILSDWKKGFICSKYIYHQSRITNEWIKRTNFYFSWILKCDAKRILLKYSYHSFARWPKTVIITWQPDQNHWSSIELTMFALSDGKMVDFLLYILLLLLFFCNLNRSVNILYPIIGNEPYSLSLFFVDCWASVALKNINFPFFRSLFAMLNTLTADGSHSNEQQWRRYMFHVRSERGKEPFKKSPTNIGKRKDVQNTTNRYTTLCATVSI